MKRIFSETPGGPFRGTDPVYSEPLGSIRATMIRFA